MQHFDRETAFDLVELPAGSELRSVTARPALVAGRRALRVELTAQAAAGVPNIDYVDMPTFVILPVEFRNGVMSIDFLSRLAQGAPDYARAFAGLAYRIRGGGEQFEAAYLRPMNGLKVNPPPPRDKRAVQYFSYPEWRFERLREEYPDGRYEAGSEIGPDDWINLRIEIEERRLTVSVDGRLVLTVDEAKGEPAIGKIGLFVDIGTEAYFSNLQVTGRP